MTVLIIAFCVKAVLMLIYLLRSKSPLKTAAKSMISGAVALVIVYFLGEFIHVKIAVSFFNTAVSLVLGIPGVALLVISQFLIG